MLHLHQGIRKDKNVILMGGMPWDINLTYSISPNFLENDKVHTMSSAWSKEE